METSEPQRRGPLVVLRKVASLGAAVAALMLGILFLIPDGNDYALVTLDKHARLASVKGPRLVFIGGSGLAYGLDSATIERHVSGYSVVNMGMNAWLGLRFLLDETSPELRSGDVLALSLEHENFRVQDEFDALDGDPNMLLMMVKTRPASLSAVQPWWRRADLVAAIPKVVHQKTMRIFRDLGRRARNQSTADPIEQIERRSGFNAYGDLVSHIGVEWKDGQTPGLDLTAHRIDERVIPLLKEYRDKLERRGVKLLFVPSPTPAKFYATHQATIEQTFEKLRRAVPGSVVGSERRYVFPESCFFDDIHHLNGKCRLARTAYLAEDLAAHLSQKVVQGRSAPSSAPNTAAAAVATP